MGTGGPIIGAGGRPKLKGTQKPETREVTDMGRHTRHIQGQASLILMLNNAGLGDWADDNELNHTALSGLRVQLRVHRDAFHQK